MNSSLIAARKKLAASLAEAVRVELRDYHPAALALTVAEVRAIWEALRG